MAMRQDRERCEGEEREMEEDFSALKSTILILRSPSMCEEYVHTFSCTTSAGVPLER